MAQLCFVCNHNPRAGDMVFCESCSKEYPLCFECGEGKRNFPFKLCTACYERKNPRSRPPSISCGAVAPVPLSKRSKSGEILHLLKRGQITYKEISEHFRIRWAEEKLTADCPSPPVPLAIYAIKNQQLVTKFQAYGEQIRTSGKVPTNSDHFFHGTALKCDILSTNKACADPDCGICGISRVGFDRERIGTNISRFKRFGHGIYLAPNSSKCHDYTQGVPEYNLRAQLLCLVACGAKYELMQDDTSLTQAPESYHSVYGKAGVRLNYDEIVVYEPDAVLPQYVVVYEHGGVEKIAK